MIVSAFLPCLLENLFTKDIKFGTECINIQQWCINGINERSLLLSVLIVKVLTRNVWSTRKIRFRVATCPKMDMFFGLALTRSSKKHVHFRSRRDTETYYFGNNFLENYRLVKRSKWIKDTHKFWARTVILSHVGWTGSNKRFTSNLKVRQKYVSSLHVDHSTKFTMFFCCKSL